MTAINRTIRKIFGAGLIGLSVLHAGEYAYKKLKPPSTEQFTPPAEKNKKMLGFFADHVTDGRHLACMEQALGLKTDISVRYMALGDPFPFADAEIMDKRGGALYIRLKLKPRDLINILKGKHDSGLEGFNHKFEEFGRPIMFSFDMKDINDNPRLRDALYYVHDYLDAANITWVWNPTLGQPTARCRPQWISLELFQRQADPDGPVFDDLFQPRFEEAKKSGLPILLVVGSKASEKMKLQFLKDAMKTAQEKEEIKGIIIYNASVLENLHLSRESLKEFSAFLSPYRGSFTAAASPALPTWEETRINFLRPTLVERGFIGADNFLGLEADYYPGYSASKCEDYGINFHTEKELLAEIHVRQTIHMLQQRLEQGKGDIYEGAIRQDLAKYYIALADNIKDNRDRVKLVYEAFNVVDVPFSWAQGLKNSSGIRIEPGYLDLFLQIAQRLAEVEQLSKLHEAEKIYKKVHQVLSDNWTPAEKFLVDYERMEAGYYSRTLLIKGTISERQERRDEALRHYTEAIGLAIDLEARHTVTMGKLGQARIHLAKGTSQKAIDALIPLFAYKELLIEKEGEGFMDLGFEAILYIMKACMLYSNDNLGDARARFEKTIPWKKLAESDDFLKAFKIEKDDLINPELDRWKIIIEGLSDPDVRFRNDSVKITLVQLREFSKI